MLPKQLRCLNLNVKFVVCQTASDVDNKFFQPHKATKVSTGQRDEAEDAARQAHDIPSYDMQQPLLACHAA